MSLLIAVTDKCSDHTAVELDLLHA